MHPYNSRCTTALVSYAHARTRSTSRPAVVAKRAWSSCRAYVGIAPKEWLRGPPSCVRRRAAWRWPRFAPAIIAIRDVPWRMPSKRPRRPRRRDCVSIGLRRSLRRRACWTVWPPCLLRPCDSSRLFLVQDYRANGPPHWRRTPLHSHRRLHRAATIGTTTAPFTNLPPSTDCALYPLAQ